MGESRNWRSMKANLKCHMHSIIFGIESNSDWDLFSIYYVKGDILSTGPVELQSLYIYKRHYIGCVLEKGYCGEYVLFSFSLLLLRWLDIICVLYIILVCLSSTWSSELSTTLHGRWVKNVEFKLTFYIELECLLYFQYTICL